MECKHISTSVRLNRDFIKNKKNDLFGAASTPDATKTWSCLGNTILLLFCLAFWFTIFFLRQEKKTKAKVFI